MSLGLSNAVRPSGVVSPLGTTSLSAVLWATETVIEQVKPAVSSTPPSSTFLEVSLSPSLIPSSSIDSIRQDVFATVTAPAPLQRTIEPLATTALASFSKPSETPLQSTVTKIKTQTVILPNTPLRPAAATESSSVSGTTWSAPAKITDLSDFRISSFPGGSVNLDIVQGIPAEASALPQSWSTSNQDHLAASDSGGSSSDGEFTTWDNSSSVLQLFYPEDSINPGNKPFGGAQFYATPLDITEAKNVTLEYSVFFPVDFEWVRGGKLPGLYGGHTGCSGGDEALDCFSTRLMWRRRGEGELYLYAPKEEQTDELCSDPQSVCDATYGFSIGRGSFTWAQGAWTTVRQTITLNIPGEQDGTFTLDVNGKRAIERDDVFYRGEAQPAEERWKGRQRRKKDKGKKSQGLGDLIDGLLGVLSIDAEAGEGNPLISTEATPNIVNITVPVVELGAEDGIQRGLQLEMIPLRIDKLAGMQGLGATAEPTPQSAPSIKAQLGQWDDKPVGFSGLFFSTFFGGHEPEFATPKDQYVWFKDFSISANE